VGAFVLGIGLLLSFINFFHSLRHGELAGKNPWNADGLEWELDSPPAPYGSVHLPVVHSRHPLWDPYDEEYDPNNQRILDEGRFTLGTSWLDARPVAVTRMPEDTIMPLVMSLTLTFIFVGLLITNLWMALAGVILSLAAMAGWLWPKMESRTV